MDIVMPQMGESIATGTITEWKKKPGEAVQKDETLFIISTDKVDAEIPSPAAGVVEELLYPEGTTLEVGTVVARLSAGGAAGTVKAAAVPGRAATPTPAPAGAQAKASPAVAASTTSPAKAAALPAPVAGGNGSRATSGELFLKSARGVADVEELRRRRSTPLVRAIAAKHGVRLADVAGTGLSGRVTKRDILAHLAAGGAAAPAESPVAGVVPTAAAGAGVPGLPPFLFGGSAFGLGPSPYPTHGTADAVQAQPMTQMRKEIAKHMAASVAFSAHVTQFIEVDFSAVDRAREALRAEYDGRGVKLSYTPFILEACTRALRAFPHFNASVDRETMLLKKDVNLGLAVALDWGLIVPVIRRADELNLAGLARAAQDLAERARARKLKPDEVQGGTFTVTNPGIFGALTGTPIINQPQVAILGVGVIEKRVVAVEDAIAIRKRAYFSLTIDHRVLDGADGARFLKFVKDFLEGYAIAR